MSKPSPYNVEIVSNVEVWDPLIPNLKVWRTHLHITQNQGAKTLGISPRAFVGYENAEKAVPWPVLLSADYAYHNPERVAELLKRREKARNTEQDSSGAV